MTVRPTRSVPRPPAEGDPRMRPGFDFRGRPLAPVTGCDCVAEAETLRRAAALMRERAAAARPSPWQVDADWWHDDDELGGFDTTNLVTSAEERAPVVITAPRDLNDQHDRNADIAYIAAMHPAVTLAVADWLEWAANQQDSTRWVAIVGPATAVARAYIGESA